MIQLIWKSAAVVMFVCATGFGVEQCIGWTPTENTGEQWKHSE